LRIVLSALQEVASAKQTSRNNLLSPSSVVAPTPLFTRGSLNMYEFIDKISTTYSSIGECYSFGNKREKLLQIMVDFFNSNMEKSNLNKIKESKIVYIDYEKASKEDLSKQNVVMSKFLLGCLFLALAILVWAI